MDPQQRLLLETCAEALMGARRSGEERDLGVEGRFAALWVTLRGQKNPEKNGYSSCYILNN